ncbi:MAG: putative dsRNA-binding protein [Methanolinea sp.]|nr:putative dsRNA-binding protein [Methanolinea sp.]
MTDPSPAALALYTTAFTHKSFAREHGSADEPVSDFEALEFLGDRVLNLVVAEYIFRQSPENEGEMAEKMEFVRNSHLFSIVSSLGTDFPGMIRLGSHQKLTSRIVASAFESFLGAYFLDRRFETTRSFLLGLLGDELGNFIPFMNYKKRLQEHIQKTSRHIPIYERIAKEGPDHAPVFTYKVSVAGFVLGTGKGITKTQATQDAARNALCSLGLLH